jgi:cyclopropane-fatty-acyl-phospholipid synthase
MDVRIAAQSLFNQASRAFTVRLWDGTVLPARQGAVRGEVIFRNPSTVTALFPPASEQQMASAFIAGEIEISGDTIDVLHAVAQWEGPRARVGVRAMLSAWVHRLLVSAPAELGANLRGRPHSKARDRDAIRHHYDVSNDFYRLFLDEAMVYSCGYFPTGLETLESAQQYKLDLICRKLSLKADERFLDIGCGWGALLFHAGSNYRARAMGITLSENQLSEGKQRLETLREKDRIELRAEDYRELGAAGPFDKIASVGMMEHVGGARLHEYFASIYKLLRPGGLFLNHAIADVASGIRTIPWLPQRRRTFMQRYIFPDNELIPIGEVVEAAERAGFEVRDLESLREHYADTLAQWLSRLEHRFDEAAAIVGQARARTWRLYLAASAVGFRLGRTGVYQLLLAKRLADGRVADVPRQRTRWYEGLLEQSRGQPDRDEPSTPDGDWRRPENAPSGRMSSGGEDAVHPGAPTT